MRTTIHIEGIECYAYHGCLPEETIIGGRYLVDVSVEKDISKSIASDAIEDTVDYVMVNRIVTAEMQIPSKLIEHVAGRILNSLSFAIPGNKLIRLKIIKFNPPVNGNIKSASIIIEKSYS